MLLLLSFEILEGMLLHILRALQPASQRLQNRLKLGPGCPLPHAVELHNLPGPGKGWAHVGFTAQARQLAFVELLCQPYHRHMGVFLPSWPGSCEHASLPTETLSGLDEARP